MPFEFEPNYQFARGRGHLRRTTIAITLALIAPTAPLTALADTSAAPPIIVNGAAAVTRAVEKNNSTFVPTRGMWDKLGAVVTFRAPSSIVATKDGAELARMTVGSRQATINGSAVQLPVAPFIAGGQAMVPLRALSEAAGAGVGYTTSPRAVHITRANAVAAGAAAAKPADAAAAGSAVAGTAATTDAAATAAAPAADAQANQAGIPWWVWLLAALLVAALVLAFLRRKKEPLITTSGVAPGNEPVIRTRN